MSGSLSHYGYALVFANVLLQQLGLPLPVLPTLVIAGAMAAEGTLCAPVVLGVTIGACLAGDSVWFAVGRRHGGGVIHTLAHMSSVPDALVLRLERAFLRRGWLLVLLAKFLPGAPIVLASLAGSLRYRYWTFIALDVAGALLWAGAALGVGMLYHRAIDATIGGVQRYETAALATVVASLLAYGAVHWWRQRSSRVTPASRVEAVHGE
jgi:membrane protein DedA with SNARE-associated domain